MITREEAWEFAMEQMDKASTNKEPQSHAGNRQGSWHYGRCHIQVLLDKIYGTNEAKTFGANNK
jgi:hypothetical protein